MTQTATKTRKQTEIQQATVNRVKNKSGSTLGYLVKSDRGEQYYQVCYLNGKLHCSCPATVECKHIRAIREIGEARKEMRATTPAALISAMKQAQEAMVAFDRDSDPHAYEILAEMRQAGASVPSYVERFQDGCRLCGRPSKSGLCYQCGM